MINLPLLIGPYHIITFVSVLLLLLLTSLYFIGKHEKGLIYFLWLIVIVFLPVIGPVAYLLKHLSRPKYSSDPALD